MHPSPAPDARSPQEGCGACCHPNDLLTTHGDEHAGHDHGRAPASPPSPDPPAPAGALLWHIPTMDCAVEEAQIRRLLTPLGGIRRLQFRLTERTLAIDAPPAVLTEAEAALRGAGFEPQRLPTAAGPARRSPLPWRLIAALGLALLAEGIDAFAPAGRVAQVLGLSLALAAIALSGRDTWTKGLGALRRARLDISALMTVAVAGALLIGQWPEAAMVMALYALAEWIEARAVDRARRAIEGLMALAPEQARIEQADGRWLEQPVAGVGVGARMRVAPGERVPLDGIVDQGHGAVDQSPVTGESVPVDKAPGDAVFAGSVNQGGELVCRVSAPASQSTLARILQAVEQAQAQRAPTQRFVDRFAAVYTPAVFALALGVALAGPLLLGWSWLDAVYRALVLLVIACPCALVIATPVSVVSALAAAARRGILIKGGGPLEQARRLRAVAFDKTGTLTLGRPRLVAHRVLGGDDQALARAASLARRSDHPVAQAIADGLGHAPEVVEDFRALAGRGVQASLNGRTHVLGNHRLIEERGQCSPALEAEMDGHTRAGHSVTLLAGDDGVQALFAVADTLRPEAPSAVAALRRLGLTTALLSGDHEAAVRQVAAAAGIAEAQGQLLPEDKLRALQALQLRHGPTAMVGDGINDAPALARADLGIAMGGAGTDIAMEAADVVVMNDDLGRIATLIRLSRRTHAVLWQNIVFALGVKAAFFALALAGSATLWMAVFADMGASLLVVANGLRLLGAAREPG